MKKYPLWKTSLVVPQKAENRTTTSPSNFQTKTYATGTSLVVQCFQDSMLPMQETQFWSLVKELRSYFPYAVRCTEKKHHIHSSFGHNSQKVAVSQSPSMDEWINKRRYIHVQYIIIQP